MKIVAGLFLALTCLVQPALAEDRFPPLVLEKMTPEQRVVADSILTGPRASLVGPFNAWLRSPSLADRLQQVGKYIRFENSLPARLSEFAILITARTWTAQFEWYAHHPLAMKGGLDPKIADQLALGKRPVGMKDDEAVVYDFVTELYRTRTVTEATFQNANKALGEQGVVDLIATCGYYDIVSMTLNVAKVPVPTDSPIPQLPILKDEPAGPPAGGAQKASKASKK